MKNCTCVSHYRKRVYKEFCGNRELQVEENMKNKTGSLDQLHLEKITWDNCDAIMNLHVAKEQRDFVASNKDSFVDGFVRIIDEGKKVFPFGIYLGKKPVGFIMITYDVGEDNGEEPSAEWFLRNSYFIWRFMIDRRYQGNGYGRRAMELALDFIRKFPAGEAKYCWLSYEPKNEVARKLYASFGFEEHPEQYEEGEEMPAILTL